MSSGKRPIGTAKGKQPNTEALCQTPSPMGGNCCDIGGVRGVTRGA